MLFSLLAETDIAAANGQRLNNNSVSSEFVLSAQDRKISGKVTDSHGEPIIGANIVEKGTTNGVITDVDGVFSLTVSKNALLTISYIGYVSVEISIKDQNAINVVLKEDMKTLDEVIVVGYGTQRKSDITSAVSVVDMDNIGDTPSVDPSRLIMGQAPGVVVKQTSGTPGKEMNITIRGTGSLGADSAPLYVVDGFPIGTSAQQSLNPNDIESISVLKDAASTSIYGARGSNGVVLITTKGAKKGELKLTASASLGIQCIPDNRKVKMMNGVEFAEFKRDSYVDKVRYFEKREPSIDEIPIDFRYPEQTKYSTDWYDEILNKSALIQNYNVTLSEGMGKVRSVVSLGYLKQDGAVIETDFERFSARANIVGEINDYLSMGWNISGSRTNERLIGTDGRDAIMGMALMADPREPIYNEDGTWNAYIGGHDGINGFPNPVMYLNEIENKQHINRVISNGYIEVTFLKDFKFKPSVNI
ncbi:SusC/RagA family TonB-linked outer membrane protein [Parabacteroides faecis]|uniref:SusC/RagA family TonB-linked outer membrane protein n=1 Tax=Parabacteroides faecis TaxID=1217282 RepID=UPI0021642C72|nr:SusC/RagA family TonB-linked outer membrane protein [Parabacteroides faecis]UVQ47815.1 SusC/RagA family TonB-linked outer membrane protein [Parabacteroides faecis]